MSVVSIVTPPPYSSQYTTLLTLKSELLVEGTADDLYLMRLIDEASETINDWAGRPLYRGEWRETGVGTGNPMYGLGRSPLIELGTVLFDGATVPATNLAVLSADPSVIGYKLGNFSTYGTSSGWSFDYFAGWWLPHHDFSGQVSVSSLDNSYNSSAGEFYSLIRPGDVIYPTGFSNAANNGYKKIVTASTTKLTVSQTLVTEAASSRYLALRNLPGYIERAALDLCKMSYSGRDRDPTINAISIGDASFSWNTTNDSKMLEVKKQINRLASGA